MLYATYNLVFIGQVRVTPCIRITSCCLLGKLRVIFYMRFTSNHLFTARVTSYFLTLSYNKIKNDKDTMILMIKNYSLGLLFDKELEAC